MSRLDQMRFSVEDVLSRKEMLDLTFTHLDQGQDQQALRLLVDSLVLDLLEQRLSDLDLLRLPHFGPLLKLAQSECAQEIAAVSLGVLGAHALIVDYEQVSTGGEPTVASTFLRSVANTIEGGTSEVLRNVVAERGLGLPR
jgi:alkylation response protein AidB-like acyl-CoA dehydrogenase